MADNTEDMLKKLTAALDAAEERSKGANKHWHDIADAVDHIHTQFQTSFLKVFLGTQVMEARVKEIVASVSQSLRGDSAHIDTMKTKLKELQATVEAERGFANAKKTADFKAAYREAKLYESYLQKHIVLTTEIAKVTSGRWTPALAVVVGEFSTALHYSKLINEATLKASTNAQVRLGLAKDIIGAQVETGASLEHVGKAAAALVNYGMHLQSNFRETLVIVSKMESGLGVSVGESAQMLVAVNRIGGSMQRVADSIARVKADTALAADEAVKFTTQISKAVTMLKPGSGSLVDQTSEYINRLAGALKQLTGSGQDIVNMLTSFTTEQGMMGAATLGATPDFLSNPAQAREVTERFVRYVDQQLAGTKGFQRMATIQLLAEQFNTTGELIVNADKMLQKYNETQRNATSLQEEWRQQTSEFAAAFKRFGLSLAAMTQQVLVPFVRLARPAVTALADVMTTLAKKTWMVYTVVGVTALSIAGLTVQLYRITAAMIQASVAGRLYEASIGGKGGAARLFPLLGRWLPTIGAGIARLAGFFTLGTVAAGLTVLAAGLPVALAIRHYLTEIAKNTRTKEELFASQRAVLTSGRHTRQELMQNVAQMIAENRSANEIQTYMLRNIASVKGMHSFDGKGATADFRRAAIQGIIDEAGQYVTQQRVRLGLTGITAQSDEDKQTQARMISLYEQIARNTAFTAEMIQVTERNHERREALDKSVKEDTESQRRLEQSARERQLEGMRAAYTSGGM